jgi:hypothetical protein
MDDILKDYQDLFFVPGAALLIKDATDNETLDNIVEFVTRVKESNCHENS